MNEKGKGTNHAADPTFVGDKLRDAGHKLNEIGENAAHKSDELIHKGQKLTSELQGKVGNYTDNIAEYIKENPVQSALIATGVGLLLGLLLKK